MKNKNLILFTHGFPYGKGEQFLETEINILSLSFDYILIYPTSLEGEKRDVPKNVEVKYFERGSKFSVKWLIIRKWKIIFKVFILEFFHTTRKRFYKKKKSYYLDSLLGKINDAEKLEKELCQYDFKSSLVYSYWFGPWGDLLAIINSFGRGRMHFVTRIHGHDYDIDRRMEGFIPFRKFCMNHTGDVVSVSSYGKNRINSEFPKFKNIFVSRLGVRDLGDNPYKKNDVFHIVSCSSLIPLKRVHLLIEIINKLSINKIKWTHFGDGPLMKDILERSNKLSSNIIVDLKGFVSNNEIIDFYKMNSIDLFVNVSEHEGVPVSIMEAISFGIPSVGCEIGGVPEIVTKESGILLEKDFEIEKAAKLFEAFSNMSKVESVNFRKRTKLFWKKYYNAEENYVEFSKNFLKS